MTFDDDFADVSSLFAEVFGTEDVVITDPAGNEFTFIAKAIGDERVEHRRNDRGTEVVVTREIYLDVDKDGRESDGRPDVLNLRGTVTLGDLIYAIERVTHSRSGDAVVHAIRIESGEKSREGYRRRNL